MSEVPFTEKTLRAAHAAAVRVHRNHRALVPYDDLRSECYVWLAKHEAKVLEWQELGPSGAAKLGKSLYRAAQKFAVAERARMTGTLPGDHTYYSVGLLEELLPDIWDYESWASSGASSSDKVTGTSRPSEGGNRMAMLVDVKWAVAGLSADDQALLRDRYEDGGVAADILAATYGTTASTIRRRVDRILVRLADRLGGEPPWYPGGGRRARSNASAQAETRSQS